MGAAPKKKMCWNCDGNVAQEVDNCPYCGVYVQGEQWSPSYNPSKVDKNEEVPSPLYQAHYGSEKSDSEVNEDEKQETNSTGSFHFLRKDLFPLLFLMMGSTFFLFGMVLTLFTQEDGLLTLQWSSNAALYFLAIAFPLMALGWKFLQEVED